MYKSSVWLATNKNHILDAQANEMKSRPGKYKQKNARKTFDHMTNIYAVHNITYHNIYTATETIPHITWRSTYTHAHTQKIHRPHIIQRHAIIEYKWALGLRVFVLSRLASEFFFVFVFGPMRMSGKDWVLYTKF